MKVLLDTCAISELRKKKPHPAVVQAVSEIDAQHLFLSIISLGEISKGLHLLAESKQKKELREWFENLKQHYQSQILGIDVETAIIWGELTAKAKKKGHSISSCDGLIAATAKRFGLHVMTRNISDFKPTGALIINPWE